METSSCASPYTIFALTEKLTSLLATMHEPRPSPLAVALLPSITATLNGLPLSDKEQRTVNYNSQLSDNLDKVISFQQVSDKCGKRCVILYINQENLCHLGKLAKMN